MITNTRTGQSLKNFILKNFNLDDNDIKLLNTILPKLEQEIEDLEDCQGDG